MTDIMAAIGLRQLDRYPGLLERRGEIVKRYDAMCDELGVQHLNHFGENYQSSKHLYLTRISGASDKTRNSIGMVAAVSLVLAFYYFLCEKNRRMLIIIIFDIVIVAISGSRKAMVARNLLRDVVGRYVGNEPDSLFALEEIQKTIR